MSQKDATGLLDRTAAGPWTACHLAEVVAVKDPDGLGRVQVRLLAFDGVTGQDAAVWARVAVPFAGNDRGAFLIPDVGDEVLVSFVNADPRFPVVVGGLWNGNSTAPESISGGRNRLKVIRSRNGVSNAFLTVATVLPSRSISILSRMLSFFSWIVKSSLPSSVSSTNVSRMRMLVPIISSMVQQYSI